MRSHIDRGQVGQAEFQVGGPVVRHTLADTIARLEEESSSREVERVYHLEYDVGIGDVPAGTERFGHIVDAYPRENRSRLWCERNAGHAV